MTRTRTVLDPETQQTQPQIAYQVAMPHPESHLFEVTLQVSEWQVSQLEIAMPVWTPGSYLVREYARHVQELVAEDRKPLPCLKVAKNRWRINTEGVTEIAVRYRVYANELTVRTNHLDSTHGYFNGAALFFFIPGWENQAIAVTVVVPHPNWKVTTSLPPVAGKENTFLAADFDTLVDSPFEIGTHRLYEFTAAGKPHTLAIWGEGNANPEQIIADTQRIIAVEAELYGDLPYDRYLFLLHLSASGFGGLEHNNSCSLNYPRFEFRDREKYNRFMQLVAHEFFHLWNVKRIRPRALETFDYERENYTPLLWFCEGATSYYDTLIPLRAGIYNVQTFLEILSKDISRYLATPGRNVQPLGESSFDAWIKLYRRDAYSDNNQISYYLKGKLVSLLLDLMIRTRHKNTRSLDDVMRLLWHKFGKTETGYTETDLHYALEEVLGMDLYGTLEHCIETAEPLPLDEYFEVFGLKIEAVERDDAAPYLGVKLASDAGKEIVKFVDANSPAGRVGIDAGDELLAIDGFRVTAAQLGNRLKNYAPGEAIAVTVFHQEQLLTHQVTLAEPQPSSYKVMPVESPAEWQQNLFSGWLGVDFSQFE